MEDNGMNEMGFDFKEEETNTNNDNSADSVDSNILNEGKSTEAESLAYDYAKTVLRWGNIFSYIYLVSGLLYALISFIRLANIDGYLGFISLIISGILAVFGFCVLRFFTKVSSAALTVFVNISTTLKRIERKMEQSDLH